MTQLVPSEILESTFALYYGELFLGTAFAVAPLLALTAGHHIRLRLDDVGRLTASIIKVRPFIVAEDWRPGALTV